MDYELPTRLLYHPEILHEPALGITSYTADVQTSGYFERTKLFNASIVLAALALLLHAVPFVLYGRDPLGYDAGFYRRYLIQPFLSIPNMQVPGLGNDALLPRIFLDLVRLAHVPTDLALYGGYVLLFACLPVLLFHFLRPTVGTRGAFIAGIFIIASSVSYNAYWYMLFKNSFALDLLLLACIALERRAVGLAILLDIAIALSHKTSAIIYLLTLGMLFIISKGRRREITVHIAIAGAFFALVNFSLVRQVELALPNAVFLEWPQYLWFSAPFLLLIVCGWRVFRLQKIPRTLIAFAFASLAFPILHLPFYERIFVFSDVALAAFAAYAADYLATRIDIEDFSSRMYIPVAALCIAIGLLFGDLYDQVRSLQPLLPYSSIQEIQTIGTLVPANALILTTANEAPWYEGWTLAHIAAPGLLHDTHNLETWEALWDATSSEAQISFLASFPQPLYISTTGSFEDLIGVPSPCLQTVAPHLLYDSCKQNNS